MLYVLLLCTTGAHYLQLLDDIYCFVFLFQGSSLLKTLSTVLVSGILFVTISVLGKLCLPHLPIRKNFIQQNSQAPLSDTTCVLHQSLNPSEVPRNEIIDMFSLVKVHRIEVFLYGCLLFWWYFFQMPINCNNFIPLGQNGPSYCAVSFTKLCPCVEWNCNSSFKLTTWVQPWKDNFPQKKKKLEKIILPGSAWAWLLMFVDSWFCFGFSWKRAASQPLEESRILLVGLEK